MWGVNDCTYKRTAGGIQNNNEDQLLLKLNSAKTDLTYFKEVNSVFWNLSERVKADILTSGQFDKEKFRKEYLNVINEFTSFIYENPESDLVKTALTAAAHCYRRLDDYDAMRLYLEKVMKEHPQVNGLAKRFMIDYYTGKKEYLSALAAADELLNEQSKDELLTADVLYKKGLILSHNLSKPLEAAECFSNIVNNYSDNPLSGLADNELKRLGSQAEKDINYEATAGENNEFATGNYPNPFNPSTTISYTVPSDGRVLITIYDVLGRKVADLYDGVVTAGSHSVIWNGSNFASGIYFYRITFKDQVLNKKILLIK